MRYEVPKADSNAIEMETPAGSIEALDPFSAPVPGQSLTTEPGSQKFEKPPEIVNPDDAVMFIINRLEEDRESKEIQLGHMAAGVPIEYIVNTIAFTGFSEGMWTPDVAELIKPPLAMYFIMQGMAEDIPMVVFNPRPTDQSRLLPEEIAQNMSRLNPEGYEAVRTGLEEEDMQNQMMEEGFLGEGQPQLNLEELPTEELPTEELSTEELSTEIPSERGML